eukprot:TRINITY_DN102004_c0_g1_i1.p1 TRINITY_DN102004_c0_g1~~TRINITY_DN102004_c0_g1_i1.p1  ORF type:complete len:425 (-),score=104.23 TRINITY_DN102004_c0_g1_i1:116-1390(-)
MAEEGGTPVEPLRDAAASPAGAAAVQPAEDTAVLPNTVAEIKEPQAEAPVPEAKIDIEPLLPEKDAKDAGGEPPAVSTAQVAHKGTMRSQADAAPDTFLQRNYSIILSFSLLLLYLVLGWAFYCGVEEWGAGDVVYFSVVVLTTVGYGDLLPTTDLGKLFTCFYACFALVIAAVAVSNVVDFMKQVAASQASRAADGLSARVGLDLTSSPQASESDVIFAEAERLRKGRRTAFLINCGVVAGFTLLGTLVFGLFKDYDEDDGNKWVNSLYLSVITLTTVGFGDFYPATPGLKVFDIFYMIVGIPLFGSFLASLTAYVFGEQKDRVTMSLIKDGLTPEQFEQMENFTVQLAAIGGNTADGHISRFEFLSFLLVKNGIISLQEIGCAMANFRDLDADQGGTVTKDDLIAWAKKRKEAQEAAAHAAG